MRGGEVLCALLATCHPEVHKHGLILALMAEELRPHT